MGGYGPRPKIDWSAVVDRMVREGRVSAQQSVELFVSASGEVHGRADCSRASRPSHPVSLPLLAVAGLESKDCDCGGWLSTATGALVASAHACFTAELSRDSGAVPASWGEVFSLLTSNHGALVAALSGDDADRREFMLRAVAASRVVADRARGVLDPVVLHRAVAAQALRVPLLAEQASGFSVWARSLRLERLASYEGFREVVPLLEDALRDFLAPAEPVLVGIHVRDPWSQRFGFAPFPWGLPQEAALLLWFHRRLDVPRVSLHLHPAVAQGLAVLASPRTPSQWSVGVASSGEPERSVADLAVLLWTESPEVYPEFDDALVAARLVG